jgi:23S rRNA U2552 (ribose-2'-O)-methylase RlmE/FtsJ
MNQTFTMVKKTIMEIDCTKSCQEEGIKGTTLTDLVEKNEALMKILTKYKNKITPYYNNKTWDKYKKISNEYEHIFTTPNIKSNISTYNPVSRSFFKMWEMINDFKEDVITSENIPIRCLFLAEGPGGFVEAVLKYRINNLDDMYYGMTLKPDNKTIPEWKLKKIDMSRINLYYGADNTGDLYNLENTHYLMNELGKNSMHLITADGGFDFSSDFNNQEDLSTKLIRCETYCALNMLADGGTYILKIYDIFSPHTLYLFTILKKCFKKLYIVKPFTSRPANSEKYLICCGYNVENGVNALPGLLELIQNTKSYVEIVGKKKFNEIDIDLMHKIVMYNMYYTSRQIYYIQRTIDLINLFQNKEKNDILTYSDVVSYNTKKCKKWCKKYNIPHNET